MRAGACKFHVKRKYGECWRSYNGDKVKPKCTPNEYSGKCDGRDKACDKAEPKEVRSNEMS